MIFNPSKTYFDQLRIAKFRSNKNDTIVNISHIVCNRSFTQLLELEIICKFYLVWKAYMSFYLLECLLFSDTICSRRLTTSSTIDPMNLKVDNAGHFCQLVQNL